MRLIQKIKYSIEDFLFRNRDPIVVPLVETDFSQGDEELAWCAQGRISDALEKARGSCDSKVDRLVPYWRMINTLTSLDRDVSNGGFHQFFTNSGGLYDAYLMEDVSLLGNAKLSGLLEKVWEQYSKIDYSDQWENRGKSWEYFTQPYKEGRWEKETMYYYREVVKRDSLMPILGDFIRKNRGHYTESTTRD